MFVAAGAAAGVSAAFGAPIGGTLFVYELSRPNTFWQFHMLWKVFFGSCVSVFTVAFWGGISKGNFDKMDWAGANVKFGELKDTKNANALLLIPVAVVLGVIGGCLGAFFINVNTRMNALRKKVLTEKWLKVYETTFFCFVTATVWFIIPYFK